MMLLTLLIALTSLASAADKTFTSFNDYIAQLPACARPCLSPLYDPVLKSCGATRASTSIQDLKCMCRGGTVSYTDQFNRGESEGKCAVEACNGEFRVEIASLSLDFAQFCIDLVGNVATESASGTSGGFLTATAPASGTSTSASDGSATSTASAAGTSSSTSGTTSASAAVSTGAAQAWVPPAAFVLMAGGVVSLIMMSL